MFKNNNDIGLKFFLTLIAISFYSGSPLVAETVIKKEKMAFEKCIKVIEDSAEKLSLQPEVVETSDQLHVAVFNLLDGFLDIHCNGVENEIKVIAR